MAFHVREHLPSGVMSGTVEAAAAESDATLDRLRATSRRLAALAEERRAEQARRDELIIRARDEGMSWRTLARAAGISVARACAIIGGPDI